MTTVENFGERIHAPELDGARAWLNVDRPLSLKELRGQVVVLDFWTYCCVNCMHVQPTLRALEEKFFGQPLVVIGVHSAKFENEQNPRRINEAVARYEIAHPIAVDDELRLWSRFAVRSWPTLIVIRPDGTIAAVAPGEPDARALERLIARELDAAKKNGTLARAPFVPSRPREADAGPLRFPGKISVAPDGRIAIADSGHHRVLVCAPDGRVLAAAGSGRRGRVDGVSTEAAFDDPEGVAWRNGRVLVCDVRNHALREFDPEKGKVSTVAGTGQLGLARLGAPAPALETALRSPWDLAVEGDTVYIALAGSHQLGVLDAARGTIAAFAGSGAEALIDGPLMEAAFAQPSGLWLDRARRRLYVADSETSAVRAVGRQRGTGETLVGEGLFDFGDVDGPRRAARLQHDLGVCGRASGEIFVADTYNGKIKIIDEARGEVRTVAFGSELLEPAGLCFAPDGKLLIADTNHHRILALSADLKTAAPFEIRGAPAIAENAASQHNSAQKISEAQISSSGADWFTAVLRLPDGAALAPGDGAVELTLLAPPGHEFAADSPLRALIEISRRPDLIAVAEEHRTNAQGGARQLLSLPARVAELARAVESELIATVDFVACNKGDAAACTPGRSLVRVPLRLAPAPKGVRALAFEVPLQLA